METEFDVDITVKDMYSFLMNNTYRKFSGILWVIMGLGAIALSVYTFGQVSPGYTVLLIVFAVLFLVLNPVVLYLKSRRQVRNNDYFHDPLHFVVNSQKIVVSQGENAETVDWKEVYKAVKYGSNVIVYITDIRTFIWPVRCIKDYDTLAKLAKEGLGARSHLKAKAR